MIKAFNCNTLEIAKSAFIREVAHIVGDMEVGENCTVFWGAIIRVLFLQVRKLDRLFLLNITAYYTLDLITC